MTDTEKVYRGLVSFVHYDKHFATIEYKVGGKMKSINTKTQLPTAGGKSHYFRVGDEINFKLRLTDRGDRQTAYDVEFLYNAGLDKLTQKARTENRFSGYLKQVDDDLYVKEIETYLFFPLKLSPWENKPGEQSFNAPVTFQLVNLDKPKQLAAALAYRVFKPEYREAQKAFETKQTLKATVSRLSPYALYVDLYDGKIPSKITLPAPGLEQVQVGDQLEVVISHLSDDRVVVQPA